MARFTQSTCIHDIPNIHGEKSSTIIVGYFLVIIPSRHLISAKGKENRRVMDYTANMTLPDSLSSAVK